MSHPTGRSHGDAWLRLVTTVGEVLEHVDRDEVAPQQARATRALSRLLTASGLTVHVERDGRRIATLGEGGPAARAGEGPARRLGRAPAQPTGVGLALATSRFIRPRRGDLPAPASARTAVPDRTPVVIGSHPTCDLVLSGLKPRHAVLGRDVQGRSVLKALAGRCYVDGSPVVSQVVDADSDIRLGEHRLTLGQVEELHPA